MYNDLFYRQEPFHLLIGIDEVAVICMYVYILTSITSSIVDIKIVSRMWTQLLQILIK